MPKKIGHFALVQISAFSPFYCRGIIGYALLATQSATITLKINAMCGIDHNHSKTTSIEYGSQKYLPVSPTNRSFGSQTQKTKNKTKKYQVSIYQ